MSWVESKSVSRILYSTFRFEISNLIFRNLKSESRVAIIPLAQTLPFGSSDLPGGCERAARLKSQPRFHCLPIWSCTARSLPGRACHHARRCALTHETNLESEISNLKC